MNIRKLFHFPTKQQTMSLTTDVENVLINCESVARKERKELQESQKYHDDICPNCRAKKSDSVDIIVNKIRQTQGDGDVSGNLFGVTGRMSVDTYAVNHCNKCGNEWEKFKTKTISRTDIMRVCLNYLAEILKDSSEKKHEWKMEAIQVFDGCYAETIYHLARKEKHYLWYTTLPQLTLKKLRRYYKSVFDKNLQELEKL
jgi:hypothetical protein